MIQLDGLAHKLPYMYSILKLVSRVFFNFKDFLTLSYPAILSWTAGHRPSVAGASLLCSVPILILTGNQTTNQGLLVLTVVTI